jgi:glucose/mannose-6-phosphate isomerase
MIPDLSEEVKDAAAAMRAQQAHLQPGVPAVQNPAKRYAGQLIGRWSVFLAAEFLVPVARRWKMQVNELGKAWAQFETLPEADHNTLAGLLAPEELFSRTMTMFINAPAYHPRNLMRSELTRKVFMLEGIPTDFYNAQGETRLAQQWTALHFGDYMAYYLAMAYRLDPTPVEIIEQFKEEMRREEAGVG